MRWLAPATALLITLATSVHAEENPLVRSSNGRSRRRNRGLTQASLKALRPVPRWRPWQKATLKPATEVPFKLKPEGKPKADKPLGAIISFGAVKAPGRYQVTLSDEAWIDIVQADGYRPSLEFSGVHGCLARDQKCGHRFSVDHALNLRFRSRLSLQAGSA